MEICLKCHTQQESSRFSYLNNSFEKDMKMVLSRLAMMEDLMSKFTNIFSQITVLTPNTEPVEVPKPPETPQSTLPDPPAALNEEEENAIVAHEYVAEKLAESEMEDSQHSLVLEAEYLDNSQDDLKIESQESSQEDSEPDLYFPLKSQSCLDSLEQTIRSNPLYKAKLKVDMRQLKDVMGTESNFTNVLERIIDRRLLHSFNWNGSKGKKELQNYTLFTEILKDIYEKMYDDGPSNYEKDMVLAIATSHRRINNQNYRKRKRKDQTDDEEETDDADTGQL